MMSVDVQGAAMDAGDIEGESDTPNVHEGSAAGASISIPQPDAARMMPSWHAALDWSEMTREIRSGS